MRGALLESCSALRVASPQWSRLDPKVTDLPTRQSRLLLCLGCNPEKKSGEISASHSRTKIEIGALPLIREHAPRVPRLRFHGRGRENRDEAIINHRVFAAARGNLSANPSEIFRVFRTRRDGILTRDASRSRVGTRQLPLSSIVDVIDESRG